MTSRSERLQLVRKRRRRRLKLSATVVVATLGALFAFVAAGSGSGAGAAPAAGGYFQMLPPGSALPSEADCAARVRRSSWEPRADNYTANHTSVTNTLSNFSQFTGAWNGQYRSRVTGNFKGTTDEIIQWAACKWGWSDELVRAEAVIESTWRQSTVGDGGTSYGLMQVRYLYHPNVNGTKCKDCAGSSWPNSANSTAFNVDLFLAEMRGCYDGLEPYLGNTRGDEWGCIGSWFSGAWRTSSSLSYISKIQASLNSKAWLSWPDQSGSLPAQPNTPQATLPPVTRATTTSSGGGQPNAQRPTTTTQPPSPSQVNPPAPLPLVTTTTVAAPAAGGSVRRPHLNELRKLRRELNTYCKKNSC
jgi:autotransporter family porin